MLYTNFVIAFIAATATVTAVLGVPIRGLENGSTIRFDNVLSPRLIGIPDSNPIARRHYTREVYVFLYVRAIPI
jgi:hypothetical protein